MKKIIFICIVIVLASCNSTDSSNSYSISLNVEPSKAGSVNYPSGEIEEGTAITLQANPNDGYSFYEWKGDITGDENPKNITVNKNLNIVASFRTYEESIIYKYKFCGICAGTKLQQANLSLTNTLPNPIEINQVKIFDENDNFVEDIAYFAIYDGLIQPGREKTILIGYGPTDPSKLPEESTFKNYTIEWSIGYQGEILTKTNIIGDSESK